MPAGYRRTNRQKIQTHKSDNREKDIKQYSHSIETHVAMLGRKVKIWKLPQFDWQLSRHCTENENEGIDRQTI